jgi:hypothetical protein
MDDLGGICQWGDVRAHGTQEDPRGDEEGWVVRTLGLGIDCGHKLCDDSDLRVWGCPVLGTGY